MTKPYQKVIDDWNNEIREALDRGGPLSPDLAEDEESEVSELWEITHLVRQLSEGIPEASPRMEIIKDIQGNLQALHIKLMKQKNAIEAILG
jgi:hypothetical protein